MSTLAERLHAAIDESTPPMTMADLARAIGVTHSSVSQWCSGAVKSMSGKSAAKAAAVLKVNVLWLTTGVGPMRQPAPVESTPSQDHRRPGPVVRDETIEVRAPRVSVGRRDVDGLILGADEARFLIGMRSLTDSQRREIMRRVDEMVIVNRELRAELSSAPPTEGGGYTPDFQSAPAENPKAAGGKT